MKKLIIPVISMMLLTSCASGQANTAAGAAIGAVAGAAVGANNKAPVAGALTGAIVGGLIGNAVDQNQAASQPPPPPVVRQPPVPQVVVREVPTVVVETPVVIEEHIWAGNDLWIYSYRGYRDNFGHVHYRNHIPTHRKFIRGGIGYRR